MAEPANRHSQQAVRRPYDNPVPTYSHQQPFYHQAYAYPYPTYPSHLGTSQYHQPLATQQWTYYNSNYYPRSPPPLPTYNQYNYQAFGSGSPSYVQRAPAPALQNHSTELKVQQEALIPQTPNKSPHPAANSRQTPLTPPLESGGLTQASITSTDFSGYRVPYYPPLPWLSVPEKPFPPRHRKNKSRLRVQSASKPVELPIRLPASSSDPDDNKIQNTSAQHSVPADLVKSPAFNDQSGGDEGQGRGFQANLVEENLSRGQDSLVTTLPAKKNVAVPVLPNSAAARGAPITTASAGTAGDPCHSDIAIHGKDTEKLALSEEQDQSLPKQTKLPLRSWAELLKVPTESRADDSASGNLGLVASGDLLTHKPDVIGQVIAGFSVSKPHKASFLEPRGLINSGNMCYMNSILQALMFCEPFYHFLSHVSRHAVYAFNSDTPLLDAMIMFVKEFNIIDSAESVEKLRLRLKPLELEQYGDPLLPEYVYEAIRRMPRFATMQRGHQQDAEEFLGFLLEELQEECARAMRSIGILSSSEKVNSDNASPRKEENGWFEVGPRQKAATTRSSGLVGIDTPINHIFGGKLRSELRIPGAKNSVTLEPYQSLQLDIGSIEVKTIVDALKGLTTSETLHGDFYSPRGTGVTATKQVFIEELPSVLILHLKRFQYDNTGGTQKIWKKIGYPLELEIPKEVFPHSKRTALAMHGGLPRYRLFSVIYHHGKSATVGHYTTDVLRQDNKEWLRIDDTVIRRVRGHEVEAGEEEPPRALTAALELHGDGTDKPTIVSDETIREGPDAISEKGWSQARGSGKKWSGVVNGTANSSGRGTPTGARSVKDNKVAYILFYEKVTS